MQEKNFVAESLIIRTRDYGDNDKIVIAFSREFGKFAAIAKGVRKQKSSLRGSVMPFTHSTLGVSRGRGSLFVITQGEVLNPFLSLRDDLDKIAYASYISELLDVGVPDNKSLEDVFLLALAVYSILDMHDDLKLSARLFELRFLDYMGLRPNLDGCLICGRKPYDIMFALPPFRGGLVCSHCSSERESFISSGTVQVIRQLLNTDLSKLLNLKISDKCYDELYRAVIPYLDYHLDYSARARKFIKALEKYN